MNPTRLIENAQSSDEVVAATAACLRFWSREELSRLVRGDDLPRAEDADDIEQWADALERQARELPLLEPDEIAREQLVRLFLLASVKIRLLDRLAAPVPARSRVHAIPGGAIAN